jgi:hypothetical protein
MPPGPASSKLALVFFSDAPLNQGAIIEGQAAGAVGEQALAGADERALVEPDWA